MRLFAARMMLARILLTTVGFWFARSFRRPHVKKVPENVALPGCRVRAIISMGNSSARRLATVAISRGIVCPDLVFAKGLCHKLLCRLQLRSAKCKKCGRPGLNDPWSLTCGL